MPFDYNPKDADNCWPAGEYDGELVQVIDKISKTKPDGSGGNPMQEWKWRVYNDDGRQQLISDYVTAAATFKIKQLAKALGKEPDFNAGRFQADNHVRATLRLVLSVEPSDEFGDKNKINKYKAAAGAPPASAYPRNREAVMAGQPQARQPMPAPAQGEQPFKEDDIPF